MRPDDQHNTGDYEPTPRRRSYSLFYFQQKGGRSYLRFTLFGLIAIVLTFVIPAAALLIVFFINSRTPVPETNVNISVIPATPFPANTPAIRIPPARSLPTPVKVPTMPPQPPPQLPPAGNTNEQLALPSLTPQPSPSASPP